MARAVPKAVIDYGFHLIISDPTQQVLGQELPALIKDGYSSFKVYMTYDKLALADIQMLEVLSVARRAGRLRAGARREPRHDQVAAPARLVERGHVEPRYHAVSHPRIGEGEATNRAIALSRLARCPDPDRSRLDRERDARRFAMRKQPGSRSSPRPARNICC